MELTPNFSSDIFNHTRNSRGSGWSQMWFEKYISSYYFNSEKQTFKQWWSCRPFRKYWLRQSPALFMLNTGLHSIHIILYIFHVSWLLCKCPCTQRWNCDTKHVIDRVYAQPWPHGSVQLFINTWVPNMDEYTNAFFLVHSHFCRCVPYVNFQFQLKLRYSRDSDADDASKQRRRRVVHFLVCVCVWRENDGVQGGHYGGHYVLQWV